MLKIIINKNWLLLIVLLYIYLPICIFLCGFVKTIYAVFSIFVIALCVYRLHFLNFDVRKRIDAKKTDDGLELNILIVLLIVIIFTVIMYFVGYGGFKEQAMDWYKHNGLLLDLIKKDWPVYYINGKEHSMLSYYVAGYMVPSFIGKICHNSYDIAIVVTWIYIEIGIILSYVFLLNYLKINKWYMQIITIFVFFFMFGLQDIGKFFISLVDGGLYEQSYNYFFFSEKLQYSSNFSLIRWVPYQGIITWLVMLLFLEMKDKIKYYVCIALPLLLYGVFPFVGVCVYMIVYVIYKMIIDKNKIDILKNIFSIENISMLLTVGIILFLYYYGNVFSLKPKEMNFRFVAPNVKNVIFIIFMVIPYVLILYKYYKNNIYYWISAILLLMLPFSWMGVFNDFMMRVSIPALFIVVLFSINIISDYIKNYMINKKIEIVPTLLCLCIVLGSSAPLGELIESAKSNRKEVRYDTMQIFANRNGDFAKIDRNTLVYNYFAYDIDDNLFYKYVARVKDEKYRPIKSGKVDTRKRN